MSHPKGTNVTDAMDLPANSVHQMHEAPGRILPWAIPICFTRSPRTRPGPVESLSHRYVLAELATEGWVPCGGGRPGGGAAVPGRTVVAGVCPFDPAYRAFVDLCRECAGNRWLPRIELAVGLEGGGSVVVLEFVAPVDHPVHGKFAEQRRARAGDAEFQEAPGNADDRCGVPGIDALLGQVRL